MSNTFTGKIDRFHVVEQTVCSHMGFAGPFFITVIQGDGFGTAYIYAYDGSTVLLPKKDKEGNWIVYYPTSHCDRILNLLQTSEEIVFSITENDVATFITGDASPTAVESILEDIKQTAPTA